MTDTRTTVADPSAGQDRLVPQTATHLSCYLAEFSYRYGTGKVSDGTAHGGPHDRTTGKRLTYSGLTG